LTALAKLFNIKDLAQPAQEPPPTKDQARAIKFLQLHQNRISAIKNLTNLPLPGECIFLFTENSFNAFTFIPYLIQECGTIDELHLSTYSVNLRITHSFARLLAKNAIGSVSLLIADSLKHRMPKAVDQLAHLQHLYPKKLKITYAWNHSKIMCARCGENYYVVEGSGNWSENSRHEQYVFVNSEEIWRFRMGAIQHIT